MKKLIFLAAVVAVLHSSCGKYELLDGCTYRVDIGASKPVTLKIGHQKQTAFIAEAAYYLPEGTKVHFKALHNDTQVRINGKQFTLKRKGDEVWYITQAQRSIDPSRLNDWIDPNKNLKIENHDTGN